MNNKLIIELKKYTYSLRDNKGIYRDVPIGVVGNASTSSEGIKRLKTIISVLLSSDSISDETKMYVSSLDMNIKDVNEEINRLRGQVTETSKSKVSELAYSNTVSKIGKDNSKLMAVFGPNIIRDCVYNRIEHFGELDDKINRFISEYGRCDKSRGNLLIDIERNELGLSRYVNNEEFFEILKSLECYLKPRKNIVENVINNNREFVKYFNYLLSERAITDNEVKEDRERLLKFLNNEDYITGYTDEKGMDDFDDMNFDDEN